MALVPTESLLDTRPPNYVKGQWFGGVPHTRVVVISTTAFGSWAWLNNGVLLGQSGSDFTDPNLGFAEWRGTVTPSLIEFVVRYRWSAASEVVGTCNFLLQVTGNLGPISYSWIGSFQATNPTLPPPKSIPRTTGSGQFGAPATIVKYDVPEWAEPLERWPNAYVSDTF